jgi:hypothetical protein
MAWKRKVQGGILGFIGFMLSPLSWWNDAFVNLPLAIGFGWIVARFHEAAFAPAVVAGYWLTNVLGLILMHKGVQHGVHDGSDPGYTRRDLMRDLAVSLAYTGIIVALMRLKILQPMENYFPEK